MDEVKLDRIQYIRDHPEDTAELLVGMAEVVMKVIDVAEEHPEVKMRLGPVLPSLIGTMLLIERWNMGLPFANYDHETIQADLDQILTEMGIPAKEPANG